MATAKEKSSFVANGAGGDLRAPKALSLAERLQKQQQAIKAAMVDVAALYAKSTDVLPTGGGGLPTGGGLPKPGPGLPGSGKERAALSNVKAYVLEGYRLRSGVPEPVGGGGEELARPGENNSMH